MKPDLALVKDFLAMDWKRFGMSFGICLSGFFSGTLETSGLKFKDVQVKTRLGGLRSTEVTIFLPTQQPRAQIPASPRFFLFSA